jgi:CRISPR-associated protein Cmr2
MTSHLLLLRVGPVQGFIAQARRTRDLWFGSHLLSSLGQHMARAALEAGASLIFPHPAQLEDEDTGFANKVLALVQGEPREVALRARQAARDSLLRQGQRAFERHPALVVPELWEVAREQLETFLEFHAAWAPLDEGPSAYAEALARAESALEARRALHAFSPWAHRPPDAFKSSLDGARPSVLRRGGRQGEAWRRYRIGLREELDALGLLKRTGGEPGQFVPVPTIGLAAFTQEAARRCQPRLAALREECQRLGFTRVRPQNLPWVEPFPFDAQLLLPERWQPSLEDLGHPEPAQEAARFGARFVQPLLDEMKAQPHPYVACLVADGDHMGSTLQALARHGGPAAHQRLSQALSLFAREARQLVHQHRGVLVYAGGDDVLAFVCVPDAPRCALALREAFRRAVEPALQGTGVTPPTLSVGLGIGHVLESLGHLLELGRRAERAAKDSGRDALALRVAKHAGRERQWVSRWHDAPVARLDEDVRLLASQGLSLGKVHEVEEALRRMPGPDEKEDSGRWARLLSQEVRRILARAEAHREAGAPPPEALGLPGPDATDYRETRAAIQAWVSRVLVADMLERSRRGLDTAGGET